MAAVSAQNLSGARLDDCWNRIGVRGDRSCARLPDHIHCRNCTVYAAAARARLDMPPPPGYASPAIEYTARIENRHAPSAQTKSVMVFRLSAEWYGIHTTACLEIADLRAIHSLPHRRGSTMLGVANVRGELLVCLSLAAILGVSEQSAAISTPSRRSTAPVRRLLVTRSASGTAAFSIDEVQGMERYCTRDLKRVPATLAQARARYTQALITVGGRTVGLLDEELLFAAVDRALA